MKEEIAKLWVAALRSGNYKQAQGFLCREDDAKCCLGVLCDLSKLGTWELGLVGKQFLCYGTTPTRDVTYPPESVLDWAGCREGIVTHSQVRELARLNDDFDKTFADIADIIEQTWEKI